jgi:hypothetical protein
MPFGAVDVPTGADWQYFPADRGALEIQSESFRTAIRLQFQPGVSPAAREAYTESYVGVNMRDAPGYRVRGTRVGSVGPYPASCVDGEFRAAIHFATRDYVVFANGMAALLMVRGPFEHEEAVQAIADRMAASLTKS